MATFDKAIEVVLQKEGLYVNDLDDPGGETKFGISKRSYPKEDIKNLTIERVKEIYKRDFWNIIKGDQIFDERIALNIFDFAVNSGVVQAAKTIQRVLGVKADGVIGNITLAVLNRSDFEKVLKSFKEERIFFYVDITQKRPANLKFLKGWIKRTLEV